MSSFYLVVPGMSVLICVSVYSDFYSRNMEAEGKTPLYWCPELQP